MRIFFRRLFLVLLIGLPIASLAINAVSWLRYGLDLPFFDDWRGYTNGNIHSLDPSYLFKPINDTLYPVGLALDALAQRYLDGNSIAYQFLTMVIVLGGLLVLQWRLLVLALGDKWFASISFVFTLLMLQPASYWGRENMAYHQALPVVFLMGALVLMFSPGARDRWRMPAIFVLGLLAGISYISGAFSILAVGITLIGVGAATAPSADRSTFLRGGLAFALAGAVSSIAQFVMAILPNGGSTHLHTIAIALPNQAEFWYVFFGKVSRSLMLPRSSPRVSAVAVVLICVLALGACILFFVRRARQPLPLPSATQRVAAVYLALAAAIFVYLLLVAAGRTNFRRPEVQSPTAVFQYGFERFHFFWVTLLWPWLVAFALVLAAGGSDHRQRKVKNVTISLTIVLMVLMLGAGALRHEKQHRNEVSYRLPTINCLMTQLQRGEGIYCPEFNMPDFTAAYMYARKIKASFVRHFPILPLPIGTDDPAPWFRLSRDTELSELRNVTRVSASSELPLLAGFSPQLLIHVGRPKEMAHCTLLDVDVLVRAEQPDIAKMLYRPVSVQGFLETASRRLAYDAPMQRVQRMSFQFDSLGGFEDELRFDPVSKEQRFDILELEVRCRLSNEPVRTK